MTQSVMACPLHTLTSSVRRRSPDVAAVEAESAVNLVGDEHVVVEAHGVLAQLTRLSRRRHVVVEIKVRLITCDGL